jgi:ABC-type thiamin/hydroxymethylpyrimidine transport system permease subunit
MDRCRFPPLPRFPAAALVVNLPLGYVRQGYRKFSIGWFVCVHLSVPLIAYLRLANHVSALAIPAFLACAVLGQFAGGRVRRSRQVPP